MDIDNYTQTVGHVMYQEKVYSQPLAVQETLELFHRWVAKNPRPMQYIEDQALALRERRLPIATKYLIEKLRYESGLKVVPVPYTDIYGTPHNYRISNDITPLLGRWLARKYPQLRVAKKKCRFDGLAKEHEQKTLQIFTIGVPNEN